MSNKQVINHHDQLTIRRVGISALIEKLGNVGAIYFIRQLCVGSGDYTREREDLHADLTFDEIVNGSMGMDAKRNP